MSVAGAGQDGGGGTGPGLGPRETSSGTEYWGAKTQALTPTCSPGRRTGFLVGVSFLLLEVAGE